MLKRDQFDAIVEDVLEPLFGKMGFRAYRRAYFRELKTGVRQSIAFDLDGSGETFHIALGLNAKLVSDELPADDAGAYFVQYLTKAGITGFPRRWPCQNEETARRSLTRIGRLMKSMALPWLRQHRTIGDFARVVPEQYADAKNRLLRAARSEKTVRQPRRPS